MNRLNLDQRERLFRRAQATKKLLRAFAYCQLLQITKRGKEHANPDRNTYLDPFSVMEGYFGTVDDFSPGYLSSSSQTVARVTAPLPAC